MSGENGIIVYAGPTLHGVDLGDFPDMDVRPPVSQGDVYSAVRERPWAIGIIDGYFERVPAVWHKEILWAMSQGVRVYGSASMGALRAAELHLFGMRGYGEVFRSYRDGALEDDDEVTIVHASTELDFMPMSDAMVNIRATTRAAVADAVLLSEQSEQLCLVAKALFYPDRTYTRVCEEAAEADMAPYALDSFQEWLRSGRRDVKQVDGLGMLSEMAADHQTHVGTRESVTYRFQHTDAWEQVVRQIDRRSLSGGVGSETAQHDAVLDELRLDPADYVAVRTAAMARAMALELAREDGQEAGDAAVALEVEAFRRRHGLETSQQVQHWLAQQQLGVDAFADLIVDEARVRRVRAIMEGRLSGTIVDTLRLSGRQAELRSRAEAKQEALALLGLDNPSESTAGISDADLWDWHFRHRLGRPVPVDLEAEAASLDYLDVHAMRRSVLREYCYSEIAADAG